MKFVTPILLILVLFIQGCTPKPTCNDGVHNQGETMIDCGGTCAACATCFDGIQNQGETGIDCGGGVCNPCATCTDGIQNQDETGVDCGGVCASCRITYPDSGLYGANVLRQKPLVIQATESVSDPNKTYYSLACNLPAGSKVRVYLETSSVSMVYQLGSGNWKIDGPVVSSMHYHMNLYATGPANEDLKVFFLGHGKGFLNIFENNDTIPTRTIQLSM